MIKLDIFTGKYDGILKSEKWSKHQPAPITESKKATIVGDLAIETARRIKSNRKDIVVKVYKRKSYLLINVCANR